MGSTLPVIIGSNLFGDWRDGQLFKNEKYSCSRNTRHIQLSKNCRKTRCSRPIHIQENRIPLSPRFRSRKQRVFRE